MCSSFTAIKGFPSFAAIDVTRRAPKLIIFGWKVRQPTDFKSQSCKSHIIFIFFLSFFELQHSHRQQTATAHKQPPQSAVTAK